MSLYQSDTYRSDVVQAAKAIVNARKLRDCSILITGATGLIGSFLVDLLLTCNTLYDSNLCIYAVGRDLSRLQRRFQGVESENLVFVEQDITEKVRFDFSVDYMIHAASNAFPAAFRSDPVGTILANVLGTKYLLEYGISCGASRFMFVSSGEVYGTGDAAADRKCEENIGQVDPLDIRSCYPLSKQMAENLCVSFAKQYGMECVIVRPCHSYGPNATSVDNRANQQFVKNAMDGKDIVMLSEGKQLRSYCYIADCASAMISVLINGKNEEAYNIANSSAQATIAEYAKIVAKQAGVEVVFQLPDAIAKQEQSPIAKQVLDSQKLECLGWRGQFSVEQGIAHTLQVLRECREG